MEVERAGETEVLLERSLKIQEDFRDRDDVLVSMTLNWPSKCLLDLGRREERNATLQRERGIRQQGE